MWADQIRNERFSDPNHSHEENLELYAYLNKLTAELLATEQSVIFDTAFNFYKDREHLRKIAQEHNAIVRLIWVQTPKPIAQERATHPEHATANTYVHAMSTEQFERISNDLEPPHKDEPYVEIDGTKVTPVYIREKLTLE